MLSIYWYLHIFIASVFLPLTFHLYWRLMIDLPVWCHRLVRWHRAIVTGCSSHFRELRVHNAWRLQSLITSFLSWVITSTGFTCTITFRVRVCTGEHCCWCGAGSISPVGLPLPQGTCQFAQPSRCHLQHASWCYFASCCSGLSTKTFPFDITCVTSPPHLAEYFWTERFLQRYPWSLGNLTDHLLLGFY